jgi:hypothetical protein
MRWPDSPTQQKARPKIEADGLKPLNVIHMPRDSSQRRSGGRDDLPHGPPLVDTEHHSERGRGEQRSSDEPHRRNETRNESTPVHGTDAREQVWQLLRELAK